jgi:hypothetical protein
MTPLLRSRYAEDLLAEAITEGVSQFVILGAFAAILKEGRRASQLGPSVAMPCWRRPWQRTPAAHQVALA